jgi:cyclopropane fatty-acyl-phospholipid synthase-like methyltransferase
VNSFDEAYRSGEGYFGELPERLLVENLASIDTGLPVLDIGSGQGRHALYLADNGFVVDALDPSRLAVDQVSRAAAARDLPIRAISGTFQELRAAGGAYGAILVFGLVPVLDREQINALAAMVGSALAPQGLLFISAFGTWDPAYSRHASEWFEVGANSFRGPDGDLRTYLEPGELLQFFPRFDVVASWEGHGPEHRHGTGPIERHGLAEAILRR